MNDQKDDSTADVEPTDSKADDRDDAVMAADDTGMLAGERLITIAEIREADTGAGDV